MLKGVKSHNDKIRENILKSFEKDEISVVGNSSQQMSPSDSTDIEKALRSTSHLKLVSYIDKNGKKSQHWINPNKDNEKDIEVGTKVQFAHKGEQHFGTVERVAPNGQYGIKHETLGLIHKDPHNVVTHVPKEKPTPPGKRLPIGIPSPEDQGIKFKKEESDDLKKEKNKFELSRHKEDFILFMQNNPMIEKWGGKWQIGDWTTRKANIITFPNDWAFKEAKEYVSKDETANYHLSGIDSTDNKIAFHLTKNQDTSKDKKLTTEESFKKYDIKDVVGKTVYGKKSSTYGSEETEPLSKNKVLIALLEKLPEIEKMGFVVSVKQHESSYPDPAVIQHEMREEREWSKTTSSTVQFTFKIKDNNEESISFSTGTGESRLDFGFSIGSEGKFKQISEIVRGINSDMVKEQERLKQQEEESLSNITAGGELKTPFGVIKFGKEIKNVASARDIPNGSIIVSYQKKRQNRILNEKTKQWEDSKVIEHEELPYNISVKTGNSNNSFFKDGIQHLRLREYGSYGKQLETQELHGSYFTPNNGKSSLNNEKIKVFAPTESSLKMRSGTKRIY